MSNSTGGSESAASRFRDLAPTIPDIDDIAAEPELVSHTRIRRYVEPGSVFAGPYQLMTELASGGMATVYLALRRGAQGFEKCCAIKRIHQHLAKDKQFCAMFADEARIAGRVNHPHVCGVFDFGRADDGSHYLAMEFLRGETLDRVCAALGRHGPRADQPRLPLLAARLVAGLAEGLHAVHTLKDDYGEPLEVIHRDVTPQNLFVLYDGTVRVTDFGIAHARQRLHQTGQNKIKGKLAYMAPEQLDAEAPDLRIDVWALGVVLWELLTGKRLFRAEAEAETMLRVLNKHVPAPSSFNPNVSPELDRIVLRALRRDRNQRYQSAREFSRELENYLTHAGDSVPAMDVAEFMTELFPGGAARVDALIDDVHRAAATHDAESTWLPEITLTDLPAKAPLSAARLLLLALCLALAATLAAFAATQRSAPSPTTDHTGTATQIDE